MSKCKKDICNESEMGEFDTNTMIEFFILHSITFSQINLNYTIAPKSPKRTEGGQHTRRGVGGF